jgi:hypothetical protein
MLLLNASAVTVEGITIFPDHADPAQFWYLPGPVQLARRAEDGRADLTFIKYRPAAVASGKGGGFLTFSVDLRLSPELERRILARLSPIARGRPKLAAVPFDEGTVKVVALDLEGAGGTTAAAAPEGAVRAVEKILGATVPSLQGDNTAAFSLALTQEGATILEKAFREGTTPVGVVYDLKFTGMRPALEVKITADMSRVYDQFAAGAEGQYAYIKTGIDAGFEKLVDDGAIRIEVRDFVGAADREAKIQWALDLFKNDLLAKYFTPTLTVGQIQGGIPKPEALAQVMARGAQLKPPPTPAPAKPGTEPDPPAKPDPGPSPTAGTGKGGASGKAEAPPPAAGAGDASSPTENTGSPPPGATDLGSAAAAGVKTAGAGKAAGGALAAVARPADSGKDGATPVVSFQFRGIHQEERKTLTVAYDRSEALQRGYAPQGFFGLLAADLARDRHFIEVDLDDPFFRTLAIAVSAPIDFDRIGLVAAQVALAYGRDADPGGPKRKDLSFTKDAHADQGWEVFLDSGRDPGYGVALQYHFDPLSGWVGRSNSYDLPPRQTGDRTLLLNPFDALGFMEIAVVANRVDWGIVDRADIELRYDGGGGWTPGTTITLTEATPKQSWKLRTDDPARRRFEWRATFQLKDRSQRSGDWVATEARSVVVDDPFAGSLDLLVVPVLDPGRTRMAILDLAYDDAANRYHRDARLRLTPDQIEVPFRLALVDPARTSLRYRVTLVPKSGAMKPGAFVETSDTLIGVND